MSEANESIGKVDLSINVIAYARIPPLAGIGRGAEPESMSIDITVPADPRDPADILPEVGKQVEFIMRELYVRIREELTNRYQHTIEYAQANRQREAELALENSHREAKIDMLREAMTDDEYIYVPERMTLWNIFVRHNWNYEDSLKEGLEMAAKYVANRKAAKSTPITVANEASAELSGIYNNPSVLYVVDEVAARGYGADEQEAYDALEVTGWDKDAAVQSLLEKKVNETDEDRLDGSDEIEDSSDDEIIPF